VIYRVQSLHTSERSREIVQLRDADFPHAALKSDLNLFSGRCSPWHWHDYFEFGVVETGSMELQTPQRHALLRPGDAYFINASVLHLNRAAGESSSVCLHVHQFDRSLVASSGLVSRRYVSPVENALSLESCVFYGDRADHAPLIRAVRHAFSAAEADDSGWEMAVSLHLTDAWRHLFCLTARERQTAAEDSREDSIRAKAMLSFIHSHYEQPVTVDQIAAAASIGERECFRCFARVLDTTPKAYLTRYRVNAAARLLTETTLSITEIAYRCGFANSSYFGKVFHQMLGRTPREFRKT